jgi:RNA polymerase sigma factor (sigma-70 family)
MDTRERSHQWPTATVSRSQSTAASGTGSSSRRTSSRPSSGSRRRPTTSSVSHSTEARAGKKPRRARDAWLAEAPAAADFGAYWAALRRGRQHLPTDHTEVRAVVQKVASEYPEVDAFEFVFEVIWRTVTYFDPRKGGYLPFLEGSLRRRLYKESRRQSRAGRQGQAVELDQVRRPGADEVAQAHRRWARRLLDLALERLPVQAQEFFALKRENLKVREIAKALGRNENTLTNKYGGSKLELLIRNEAVAVVRELLPVQFAILVRHLHDEVGLTTPTVERLLGVPVGGLPQVPLLEEDAVLAFIGWDGGHKLSGGFPGSAGVRL